MDTHGRYGYGVSGVLKMGQYKNFEVRVNVAWASQSVLKPGFHIASQASQASQAQCSTVVR